MEISDPIRKSIRFGVYEVDTEAGELRKNGVKVKLQEQPFQVLVVLLRRHGRIVTREELREQVWPGHTFVDFDQGLNTAIAKIREALGDSASNPRFVETVPRRGYKFIAPVELPAAEAQPEGPRAEPARRRSLARPFLAVGVLAGLAAGIVLGLLLSGSSDGGEMPLRRFTITPDEPVRHAAISPDGRYIAYVAGSSTRRIWLHDLTTARSRQIEGTDGAVRVFWSPDSEFVGFGNETELKKVAIAEGAVVPLCPLGKGNQRNFSGAWSGDGASILFSNHPGDLFRVSSQGGTPTVLVETRQTGGWVGGLQSLPHDVAADRVLCVFGPSSDRTVGLLSPATGERIDIVKGFEPAYSPSGHVLFRRGISGRSSIMAVRFGDTSLSSTETSVPVARSAFNPSMAMDGTLVYISVPIGDG